MILEETVLDEVLKLRNRGLSIFPVSKETKVPVVKWGKYQTELPTFEEVKDWFKDDKYSVGVATGPISRLFLLDFDFAKHPEAREFYEAHTFPITWAEKTRSDGLHVYFKWDTRLDHKQCNTESRLWVGVDTKGQGGYSKIAPSEGYRWVVAPHMSPLASVPQWLVGMLNNKGIINTPVTIVSKLANIKDGNRNASFTSLAGGLRARGYTLEEMYAFLEPRAKEVNFPLEELLAVCRSVSRYEPKLYSSDHDDSLETFFKETKPREWLIQDILAKESITFIAGLPKCAKSWILIDLALEASRDNGKWLGKFPIKKCNVMYIDQERSKDESQRRFLALMSQKNLVKEELSLRIKSKTSIKLDIDSSFEAFKKELRDKKPDLILIDSFIAFHNKNVMDQVSIMPVLERLKELRNEFKCSFVFIYHDRKGSINPEVSKEPSFEDMVGSIFISSVADHCFSVRKQGVESMVYNTANNLGVTQPPFLVAVKDLKPDRSQIVVEAF